MDIIIRHPRERKSKCTLEPLRGCESLCFYTARPGLELDATGYVVLAADGDDITAEDEGRPLLLLDSTWKLLPALQRCIVGSPLPRRLPLWLKTAYPRKSKDGSDPSNGLASVEALYAARRLLGRRNDELLDHYHWKASFLAQWCE